MIYKFDTYDTVQVSFFSDTQTFHTITEDGRASHKTRLNVYKNTKTEKGFVIHFREIIWDIPDNTNNIWYIFFYNSVLGCVKISDIDSIVRCRMVLIEKYDLKRFEEISPYIG